MRTRPTADHAVSRPYPLPRNILPLRPGNERRRRPAPSNGSRDGPALAASQARHPSVARTDPYDEPRCPACGRLSVTPTTAAAVIIETTAMARSVLEDGASATAPPTTERLKRIAQLRDELHALANRVARLEAGDVAELPTVRISTPTAATRAMSPPHVLHELERSARRLIVWINALPPDAWQRPIVVPGGTARLAFLVDRVLHGAMHDLMDLTGAERHACHGDGGNPESTWTRSPR